MENTSGEKFFYSEDYAIRGAIFDVYRTLGCGFLESVYQESLEIEFGLRRIPFISQKVLQLQYKGILLKHTYKPDFILYGKIIMEIKSTSDLTLAHQAQLLNYLSSTGMQIGYLVNFGHYPKAEIIRLRK